MIISLIQAVTEFLPISSSGHLLFYKGIFAINDIHYVFDIIVHVASMLTIIVYYRKKIYYIFKYSYIELHEKQKVKSNSRFLSYIVISTLTTFIFYLFFSEFIETRMQSPSILFITFLLTSIILFITYFFNKREKSSIVNKGLLLPIIVGLLQGCAILPGFSRSGATIAPLLLMGIREEEAAFYSLFLACPAILGALIINIFNMENINFILQNSDVIVISFIIALVVSYIFIKMLLLILRKEKFWIFSFYTLLLAIMSLIFFSM